MSATSEPASDRMDQVAALTTDLCNAVLHSHLMGHGVTNEQVHALAKAARLFQDEGQPWPPILEQVLHELTRGAAEEDAAEPPAEQPVQADAPIEGDQRGDEKGVKCFLSALKRKRD